MSERPEPFEFDIAREFPDGLIVGGVFYPLMVDCPNDLGAGHTYADCVYQCGGEQVRNPALEWLWVCMVEAVFCESEWMAAGHCGERHRHVTTEVAGCRWVAVGVKKKSTP